MSVQERELEHLGSLVEEHLPLVRHVVFQVAVRFPRHVDREELVRAGTLGLLEAAQRYDESRGVPFPRFAAQRIRGAILDAVRASDWAPRSLRTMARGVDRAEQNLTNSLGRSPTLDEVATEVGLTREAVVEMKDRMRRSVVLALDFTVTNEDEEECSLGDMVFDRTSLDPSEVLENRELRSYLHDALALLPERHRQVVAGYFLEGQTSDDLAASLGVTTSRISQLRSEALAMLRDGIDAQYLSSGDVASTGRAAQRKASYATAIATRSAWRNRLDQCTARQRHQGAGIAEAAEALAPDDEVDFGQALAG